MKWHVRCRLHQLIVAEMVTRPGGSASSRLYFSPVFFLSVFVSFSLFFSALFFLLSFSLLPSFFCSFSSFFFVVRCLLSPLYLQAKQGRKGELQPLPSQWRRGRVAAATTVQPPHYHPRDTSPPSSPTRGKLQASEGPMAGVFLKEQAVENRGRTIFFFPCFARSGEEEDPKCHSKRHRFGLPFF